MSAGACVVGGQFVEDTPMPTYKHGLATVLLHRRNEFDPALAVPVVVAVHKWGDPLAGGLLTSESSAGIVRPIFSRAEQGFRVEVVVGDPRSVKGTKHAQLLQPALERCSSHCDAVVGVQQQRILKSFTDPLSEASPSHQIRCNGWILALGDIPVHHLETPHVDYQVEVQAHPGRLWVGK